MRSPPHQERPASSPRAAIKFRGGSSQRQNFTPDWASSLHPIYDDNGVCRCRISNLSILDGENQGGQCWTGYQDIHKIAGLHDKPGRVIWLTRLDRSLHEVRPPCRDEKDFLRRRCISPRSGRRKFKRWTLTQKGLLTLTLFRLGQ
jgi:hypothetical protein